MPEGPDKVLTGIPLDVRIMTTSVSENSRLEDDFAAVNLVSTRPGSAADSPRSILMQAREAKVDARRFPATFGLAQSQTLAPELQSDLTSRVLHHCHHRIEHLQSSSYMSRHENLK